MKSGAWRQMQSLAAATLAALALAAPAAVAARPSADPRRVTRDYTGPGVVNLDYPTGGGGAFIQGNGIELATRASETHVRVDVTDNTHPRMGGYVEQNRPRGDRDVFKPFCGSTEEPIAITGGRSVWIYVSTTPCGEDGGIPTSGEVVATFTR